MCIIFIIVIIIFSNRLYFLSQKDQCNYRNTGLLFNESKNRCYDGYVNLAMRSRLSLHHLWLSSIFDVSHAMKSIVNRKLQNKIYTNFPTIYYRSRSSTPVDPLYT